MLISSSVFDFIPAGDVAGALACQQFPVFFVRGVFDHLFLVVLF
jgi:hypothetical protein